MSLRPLLPALPSLPAEPAGPSMWDSIQALGRGAERKMARERKHGTAACTPQLQPSLPLIGSIPLLSECDLDLGDGKDYHGTAPNCDWGWTGPNCERPLCGAYHWPSIEKWAAKTGNTCALKPDKNVGGKSLGLHAKLRRIGDSMHIPEHWMREDWIWLLTVLAALAILRKNAQFIITLGILQLLMKLS